MGHQIADRSGKRLAIGTLVAVGVVLLAALGAQKLVARLGRDPGVVIGKDRIRLVERVQTGHQRAERVLFLAAGRYLAVTCPRYDQLVIYEVEESPRRLRLVSDCKLPGKPVALAEVEGGVLVLQRPAGDLRHVEPGFCETYDLSGHLKGPRWDVGYDPDDLVMLDHGRIALVLLSGNSEGELNRPDPEIAAFDLSRAGLPEPGCRVRLGGPETDPIRITLSARQTHAAIAVRDGSLVGIDLSDPARPRVSGTISVSGNPRPAVSVAPDDVIVLPSESLAEVAALSALSAGPYGPWSSLVTLDADAGELIFYNNQQAEPQGRYRLHGPGNLGQVRVCGLGYSPERKLLAVADRSGGLHLLERLPASGPAAPVSPENDPPVVAVPAPAR